MYRNVHSSYVICYLLFLIKTCVQEHCTNITSHTHNHYITMSTAHANSRSSSTSICRSGRSSAESPWPDAATCACVSCASCRKVRPQRRPLSCRASPSVGSASGCRPAAHRRYAGCPTTSRWTSSRETAPAIFPLRTRQIEGGGKWGGTHLIHCVFVMLLSGTHTDREWCARKSQAKQRPESEKNISHQFIHTARASDYLSSGWPVTEPDRPCCPPEWRFCRASHSRATDNWWSPRPGGTSCAAPPSRRPHSRAAHTWTASSPPGRGEGERWGLNGVVNVWNVRGVVWGFAGIKCVSPIKWWKVGREIRAMLFSIR